MLNDGFPLISISGGSGSRMPPTPKKFLNFIQLFGKFWQNQLLVPPGGFEASPMGIPLRWRLLLPVNEVWGKVIFSQACVKNSVHRGGGIPVCIAGGIPACLAADLQGAIPACLTGFQAHTQGGSWGGLARGACSGGFCSWGGLLKGGLL